MWKISEEQGIGTLAYNDVWELFDQIIISPAFINQNYFGWQFRHAKIADLSFLRQTTGKYKGYPLRTNHLNAGYSDHFPVYITLVREAK